MAYRLPPPTWHGLLSRAALLTARVERLGAFSSLIRAGSAVARSAFNELHLAAARAGLAGSDRDAVIVAEEYWQARLEDGLMTPDLTSDETRLLTDLKNGSVPPSSADPFALLYEGVVNCASELYGNAWPGAPTLMVLPCIGHPRSPPDPYAVTGQTVPTPKGLVVELQIQPDGLGPATFLVIPAVLVHECVSHIIDLAAGGPIDNESPFSEGLMDWASGYHLRRWLPLLCPGMAAAATVHAQIFSSVTVPRGDRSYSARLVGWTAADELVSQLVNREGLALSAAETLVASLAIRMNVCEASGAARDVVVQRIEMQTLTIADPTLRRVLLDEGPADSLF